MSGASGSWGSLEFLGEPALLIRRHGTILKANGLARRTFRTEMVGDNLLGHVEAPHSHLKEYLRRASGSTAPIVGGATLLTADGPQRFRLSCAALSGTGGDRTLVLRCHPPHGNDFSGLRRRVRELDAKLRARLQEKAALQRALSENETLLLELQHRVKNNVQMMHSLIQMSAKDVTNEETLVVIERARLRLMAMASAQDAIYHSKHLNTVAAGQFLEDLVMSIGQTFEVERNLRVEIEDAALPAATAHSLALIVNELMTNAIKHGLPDRQDGTIRIRFAPDGDGFHLLVHDAGPGMPSAAERASGLKLVRGLSAQIGGSFDMTYEAGTKCSVRFNGEN